MMRFQKAVILIVVSLFAGVLAAQESPAAQADARAESLLGKMTLEEKIELIGGTNTFFTRPIPRLAIPSLKMSDGPMGVHDFGPTTAYPAGIALAASWNLDLARRVGEAMGRDARARGVHFILGPGVNIYRAPMCGRNFEYFGEDPFLASRMTVAVVTGIQSRGVVATVKHFAGNNSEYGRLEVSSDIDERTLREIYLPAFEASVKEAGAGAVMDAYNPVNGVFMTENATLNDEILKKDWGFNGILMSDWGATHDGVASANGGLDLEMPSAAFMTKETLLPVVKDGRVPLTAIDDKVRRILRTAIRFGFFDNPQTDMQIPLLDHETRALALEEARESMVLLKNDANLLPLDKNKVKTIAVIGPGAYPAVVGGGGSSLTTPFNSVSFLEGVSDYLGKDARVLYATDLPDLDQVYENTQFINGPTGAKGLQGEYFDGTDLKGEPRLKRTDTNVDFHWGDGSYVPEGPSDNFSVRWTGEFVAPKSGGFNFYTYSDDGVRLYVDEERVIDDWQIHGEKLNTYGKDLVAGRHYKLRLEYFEAGGGATVAFGVSPVEESVGRQTRELAARADAVILCVGFNPTTEGEGFDRTFRLPAGQNELIRQIVSANRNTIVVLTAGGSVDMTPWLDQVPALLHAWYPGEQGGRALAQIVFGEFSPSGKLPASFERQWEDNPTFHSYYPAKGEKRVKYSEGVFLGYRYYDHSDVKPLFPFGFGLSYTTFSYSNLSVTPKTGDLKSPIVVAFDVKNTGSREAAEVAQVYVSDLHSSVPRPVKELKGFSKVSLKAGETKRVTVSLNRRAFSFYDVRKKDWSAEPGQFFVLVGGSSVSVPLKATFTLTP